MSLSRQQSLAIIVGITLYRLVMLHFDGTDLFVDEAQYWHWSQHLDFGYYSKPPMIAWVIHLATVVGGSSDIFWVRMASPLLHMATALILMPATARLTGSKEAAHWVGASYVTLPGVALSSVFMSTDTVLFPFLALALYAYSHLIERRSARFAVLMGFAIGCGTLSKYAMLYFVGTAALSALAIPHARPAVRDAALASATALLVISPNIWWNATHGAATLKHTSDNADWNGLNFHIGKALEFFVSQFAVVGPVLFGAMILVFLRLVQGRITTTERHLFLLSWPIVLAIVFQALMSRAYANWAATAYAAGTMLAVVHLLAHAPRALRASLLINGTASVVFAVLTVFPQQIQLPDGKPVLARYLGRAELSREIAAAARAAQTDIIVAESRDVLADLFYTLRDENFIVRAKRRTASPRNYYEQMFPMTEDWASQRVLYVTGRQPDCEGGEVARVADLSADSGYYAGARLAAYALPGRCLLP